MGRTTGGVSCGLARIGPFWFAPGLPVAEAEAEIDDYRDRLAEPGMTAGEFAGLLPERLRQPYWESKIRELAEQEGMDPDVD